MRLKDVKSTKLRKLIKEFISWYPLLSQKDFALGRCWDMTEEFIKTLEQSDYKGEYRAIEVHSLPDYTKHVDSHWVAWVDGLHIDFTAKQFHCSFAFPRLWRGKHGCKLERLTKKLKNTIGIDSWIDVWEYCPIRKGK